jgi:hypothetical protein
VKGWILLFKPLKSKFFGFLREDFAFLNEENYGVSSTSFTKAEKETDHEEEHHLFSYHGQLHRFAFVYGDGSQRR